MSYAIDISAARREIQHPNGVITKISKDIAVTFPAELPLEALDPILSDDLDLVGLIGDIVQADGVDGLDVSKVVTAIFRRPSLPRKFLAAVRETYEILLGDQFEEFLESKPSSGDYLRLTIALSKVYGVELGKLLRSLVSSESDSPTSSQTSPGTTGSTPAESGSGPDTPTSSGPDA
ncbi:hypothetical protein [Streptomyces anulatus]|uniref:hypothetical protein n=1 Tax=Streptomyces anulatus TaxID=1892 RepID=UPI0037DD6567|nr:hypothetical protein OHB50_39120 [Streptomyces anulatus]